jgi:hypothetical protein
MNTPLASTPSLDATAVAPRRPRDWSRHLHDACRAWMAVALGGLWLFALYVVGAFGLPALAGNWEAWGRRLPRGLVAGDAIGNAVLVAHLLFTVVLVGAATLQFLPAVRRRWPALHRASGRLFLGCALLLAGGGLWMVWARGTVGDLSQHLAISVNALLIFGCAAMAWREAVARRIDSHRRWALRLFVAVCGVFFFRVVLMLWLLANRGPAGFDPQTFSGPALTTIAWAVYVFVPLAVLQAVLVAQRGGSLAAQRRASLGMAALTLVTAVGVLATAAFMWWPRMG